MLVERWCLDHRGLLGLGGLHLQCVATLGAIIAEQVIWRRLPCFDDEDALRGQGGENGQRVHIYRDPDETEETKDEMCLDAKISRSLLGGKSVSCCVRSASLKV